MEISSVSSIICSALEIIVFNLGLCIFCFVLSDYLVLVILLPFWLHLLFSVSISLLLSQMAYNHMVSVENTLPLMYEFFR